MKTFFYRTFAKAALAVYAGGTVAHTLRLIYRFQLMEAPSWIHWGIVSVGGYACIGFLAHLRIVPFRSLLDRILYGLVILHLGISVILHGYSLISRSNAWMGLFPLEYSYFALIYFVGLGGYSWFLSLRILRT